MKSLGLVFAHFAPCLGVAPRQHFCCLVLGCLYLVGACARPCFSPPEAVSIALSASALLIFLCGLVSFGLVRAKARRLAAESRAESRGARGPERGTGGPRGYRSLPNEDLDF